MLAPFPPLDDEFANRKRTREELEEEKQKNRGNYRCSKCNLPKKGHVCPYQPKYKRRDQASENIAHESVATQAEIDPLMTVRELNLSIQGTVESYFPPEYVAVTQFRSHFPSTPSGNIMVHQIAQLQQQQQQHLQQQFHSGLLPGNNLGQGLNLNAVHSANLNSSMAGYDYDYTAIPQYNQSYCQEVGNPPGMGQFPQLPLGMMAPLSSFSSPPLGAASTQTAQHTVSQPNTSLIFNANNVENLNTSIGMPAGSS